MVNSCETVPLHVHSSMFVPSSVPPPLTSTHLPQYVLMLTMPLPMGTTVNTCETVWLHVHSSMFVPSAVPPPLTSTHLFHHVKICGAAAWADWAVLIAPASARKAASTTVTDRRRRELRREYTWAYL